MRMSWLPIASDWRARLRAIRSYGKPNSATWNDIVALAKTRLDLAGVNALDSISRSIFENAPADALQTNVRLALFGTSTLTHLIPSIRVAGLRRGIWVETFEPDYGQYLQALAEPDSPLYAFQPTAVVFAFDARYLREPDALDRVRSAWRMARSAFQCQVMQQAAIPILPSILGENEHRISTTRASSLKDFNSNLRRAADEDGVDILAIDDHVAVDGIDAWHDRGLWYRAKQEVVPTAAPHYGDLVMRVVTSSIGRSAKCLVLDLDNTLWGGVIGDDGPEGILLGQGSPLGEAFVDVQSYAKELSRRGVILAVCSKNAEAVAIEVFERHPEMVLRLDDIAVFVANWEDKASNIRTIAERLNIGLDSLVFMDDNPFERNLVRQELPMVAVPELPEDPALFVPCLADAGYFEATRITDDDLKRSSRYQANSGRDALRTQTTDLVTYLKNLEMRLICKPFDDIDFLRIVQLSNKTNQFNLTTKRYSNDEMLAFMHDVDAIGLSFRLLDRFGDNGIVGLLMAHRRGGALEIETWLMSCRVLGRNVEDAMLDAMIRRVCMHDVRYVRGTYRRTAKNSMVSELYDRLGFDRVSFDEEEVRYEQLITRLIPSQAAITLEEG